MAVASDETIVALASAAGAAPRAIVRLSGPRVLEVVQACFQVDRNEAVADLGSLTVATRVAGVVRLPELSAPLPCDLYLWPTERSYTHQPMAELHLIGSPPLVDAVLNQLSRHGARPAQPGEFTLRAFLAGRLDLTQAEAVLGTIDAADRSELDTALAQLAGGLAAPLGRLRERLLDLLAWLEAGLDFADEQIEFISTQQLDDQLAAAADEVAQLVAQMQDRSHARAHARIVLLGWPNTGKSSLLNALAGDDVALVSTAPGTTRDYLTRDVEIGGVACTLIDTAGVEPDASDDAPAAAQQMAVAQGKSAQLRLFCVDATRPPNRFERQRLAENDAQRIVVHTKCDLVDDVVHDPADVPTSSRTDQGLDRLRRVIAERLGGAGHESTVVGATAVRCRASLDAAQQSLRRARQLAVDATGEELVAAEIRCALDELGKVVGAVYTEDILDRVFGRFCIGK